MSVSNKKYVVIVHGGAWAIPDDRVDEHLIGVKKACESADSILAAGGNALDAVQAAIETMESSGVFDAGRGSFVNQQAEVEMDALIATDDYKLGSVCALQNVLHPIAVARLVRDKTKHVMLVGNGAFQFAMEEGIKECKPEDLLEGRELQRYLEIKEKKAYDAKSAFRAQVNPVENGMGTVGCVCLDTSGRFAIGVSTGGTPFKKPGRVGDSPIWGCGGYTESGVGGVAATGYGEDLIRVMFSRHAAELMRSGFSATDACKNTVEHLSATVGGLGGLVAIDKVGNIGFAFNTPRMAYAFKVCGQPVVSGI